MSLQLKTYTTLFKYIYIMEFLRELWAFLKVRKKFWLLPLIIILIVFGVLIVLSAGSAIAPFVYTLF